jgi:hypothetical protein
MQAGLRLVVETREVEQMLTTLIQRTKNPGPLLKQVERYINVVTLGMFFKTPRPDTGGRRGILWPKLKWSTIARKRQLVKQGKAISADRPLVETGKMRDSIRVLSRSSNGFVYGTDVKSKDGFNYPGFHNESRPWLFLTNDDFQVIGQMAADHISGTLKQGEC